MSIFSWRGEEQITQIFTERRLQKLATVIDDLTKNRLFFIEFLTQMSVILSCIREEEDDARGAMLTNTLKKTSSHCL